MIAIRPVLNPVAAQGQTDRARAGQGAVLHAPYLARLANALARRAPDRWSFLLTASPAQVQSAVLQEAAAAAAAATFAEGMSVLRFAKADLHLSLALLDLSLEADLEAVTQSLSDFADAALSSAISLAQRVLIETGDLRAPVRGYSILAMGKHGARELNYSSDIDLIVLFAPNWLAPGPRTDARQAGVKLTQLIVRAIHEVTADGYVFRTDLRLRPDPASTPIAVTFAAAERYYQSVGENWERAAFIKARSCAGDCEMGETFLASLRPFVWRRHLDYAAIDDIRAIQRQIHRVHKSAPLDQPAFDVKLGHGGIRDIELFVQSYQLILGGRSPHLRAPATLDAIAALRADGVLSAQTAEGLTRAYRLWRALEHRIQMRLDEHTHDLPADPRARAQVAALCGHDDLAAFDKSVVAQRHWVAAAIADYAIAATPRIAKRPSRAASDASASEPKSPAAEILQSRMIDWRRGEIRALKTPRARALMDDIAPNLIALCSAQADPDAAFSAFADFIERLSFGVQVLALLQARPDVLSSLINLFAIAPRLGPDLARRPNLIDAMGDARFFAPIAGETPGARRRALQAVAGEESGFEAAINAVRRYHREDALRITDQLLRRTASPRAAGQAFAELADACVGAVAQAALADIERQYGRAPGRHVVLALGKFAGRELSVHADLDLMLIYDAPDGARSDGPRALPAGDFYTRLAQRLIAGLSAPTEEGVLYDIDMRLRPSGAKGPVAVRLSSFARYYREEAWTWELQSISRARTVIGDDGLSAEVIKAVSEGLSAPRDPDKVRADVAAMRARLARDKPAYGVFDLKLSAGGMLDVEFIAQGLLLAASGERAPIPPTVQALAELARTGQLTRAQEQRLREAFDLYTDLQHILRAAAREPWRPEECPKGLQALLCAVGDADGLPALKLRLGQAQAEVRALFTDLIGKVGDGNEPLSR